MEKRTQKHPLPPSKNLSQDETDFLQKLAFAIKYFRKERGLSQQALADKIGFSRLNITFIENGKRTISVCLMAKIATALGFKLSQFIEKVELLDLLDCENNRTK